MKKNILITTGGSGGHVIPATIFFDHLSKDANIIISTDKRGLKYLDKDKYELKIIDTPKLDNIFYFPINLTKILYLILKSLFFLKIGKITKVISTGGYMSLPIIIAAKLLSIDVYLFEPNSVLGRANKLFLKYCVKIFCYTKKILNFPEQFKYKMVIIDPLVRKKIYELNLSIELKDRLNLLIIGGSQGASIFDENLKNCLVNISKKIPIKVIHQTSEKKISDLKNFYSKNGVDNVIFSFQDDFDNIIKQANLCITRCGASTLAELSNLSIPFIAVPLPSAKDNHQFENANFYKNQNCCWMIRQDFFEENIEQLLNDIFANKTDYLTKKDNLKKLNYKNTWINVNQKILININEN